MGASNGGVGGGSSGAGSSKGAGGAGKLLGAGGKAGGNGLGGAAGASGAPGASGAASGAAGVGLASAGGGDVNSAGAASAANAQGGTSANIGGASAVSSGGQAPDVTVDEAPPFFSEYVEGSSSFKALEIAANAPRELAGCEIGIYTNGSTKRWRSIELSGLVSREKVLVICSPELAALVPACSSSGGLSFTGNDVLLLSCSGTVVDAFGRLGEDPGPSGWGAPNGRTNDVTLRRFCDAAHGDVEPNDAFDPALDWSEAPLDSFEDLGVYCAAP